MNRVAAALAWTVGLGFGVFAVIGTVFFARSGRILHVMGFPAYGEGPFERVGIPTSIALLAGFVAVCTAEVVVGTMLWTGRRGGRAFALALLPFELAYWVGFALPYALILGLARAVAVIVSVRAQNRRGS